MDDKSQMEPNRQITCWVVSDGAAGAENQCVGLAAALGLTPGVKRVRLRAPWRQLTPFFRLGLSHAFDPSGDSLTPPWPDLLIASGRRSVLACLYVKQASLALDKARATYTVQIQDPGLAPSFFDKVIVPQHDRLRGKNVLITQGSLHKVTAENLAAQGALWRQRFADLPRPYIGALIGGSNSVYTLGAKELEALLGRLVQAARHCAGSLLVTASRRTGEANLPLLQKALADVPHFLWQGTGDNPYLGILGLADWLLVTADSVNMVSEACSTGKPVYILTLPGGSAKFSRFHENLLKAGRTRAFEGVLEAWPNPPLDDVQMAARAVADGFLSATGRPLS